MMEWHREVIPRETKTINGGLFLKQRAVQGEVFGRSIAAASSGNRQQQGFGGRW